MPLPPLRTLVVPQGRVTQDVLAAHLLKLHPLCKDPEAAAQPRGWGWASRGLGLPSAGLGQERAPRDPVTLKLRFVCWRQSWPRGELGEAPPKAKGQQGPRAGWTEPCGDAVGTSKRAGPGRRAPRAGLQVQPDHQRFEASESCDLISIF